MASLVLIRGAEVMRGVHFGKPVTAEIGTIQTVGSGAGFSSVALERLDGYVRLPCGLYALESTHTLDGLRALRFIEVIRSDKPLTPKQSSSFYAKPAGRFYVHAAKHPANVKGCVGVTDFSRLMERLGVLVRSGNEERWNVGARVLLEIKRNA